MANICINEQVSSDAVQRPCLDEVLAQVKAAMHQVCVQAGLAADSPLSHAVDYHFAASGRLVRARLCIDAGLKCALPTQDIVALAQVVEYLHNASLVHDDIQDGDAERRGRASLWQAFDTNVALCTGDFLLSAAYVALASYSRPQQLPALMAVVHRLTAQAIQGQIEDLDYVRRPHHSLAAYLETTQRKSGALLYLPFELCFTAAGLTAALPLAKQACMDFAVGYQMYDDLQDALQDCPTDGSAAALNILSVLQADLIDPSPLAAATQQALDLCQQHLRAAHAAAEQLPAGTGELLIKLCADLQHKCHRMSA